MSILTRRGSKTSVDLVMLDVLVFGITHQVKCYLRGESELSSAEIVTEINKLFRAALPLYR